VRLVLENGEQFEREGCALDRLECHRTQLACRGRGKSVLCAWPL